jgi:hypothetical protein
VFWELHSSHSGFDCGWAAAGVSEAEEGVGARRQKKRRRDGDEKEGIPNRLVENSTTGSEQHGI